MKRTILAPLLPSLTLLVAGIAPATANEGPYVGIEGGFNFQRDQNLVDGGPTTNLRFKDGFGGGFMLGHPFSMGLRPELAIDYRRNSLESASTGGLTQTNVDGHEELYSAMG